jgi:DNA-directed RNA polymerase specialized sigma24 family protein
MAAARHTRGPVLEPSELERFEAVVLPHLSAAYRLARYLTRNDADADDVVQEACLRALKYFGGFRGEGASQSRAWLLTIVRNMAHTWRGRHRLDVSATEFDETVHSETMTDEHPDSLLSKSEARDAGGARCGPCSGRSPAAMPGSGSPPLRESRRNT